MNYLKERSIRTVEGAAFAVALYRPKRIKRPSAKSFVVYKITNLVNGKIYAGRTMQGYLKRFQQHVHAALTTKSRVPLAVAIRKFGAENFRIEVIEQCKNFEHMCERERFWIRELKSYDYNIGYNATTGDVLTFDKCF